MSALDALTWCIGLALLSLFLVSYINDRQAKRRLVKRKVENMKRRIVELEEICALIEPLIENNAIIHAVVSELIALIGRTRDLDPASHYLDTNLATAEERLRNLQHPDAPIGLWRVLGSDAAIARARFALNECGRIVRKLQQRGEINPAEMELYINELAWSHLMVGVITLVSQGHKTVNNGDVLKGFAFYKNAQQVLTQSNHPDERKHQFIKELGEILNGQRKAISPSLMPETDYNPSEIKMQRA